MCFLIPLLTGLISALLGYLLGKMMSGGNSVLQSKLDQFQIENDQLNKRLSLFQNESATIGGASALIQADLDKCRAHSAELQAEVDSLKAKLAAAGNASAQGFASAITDIPFDADLAFSVFGKKIKQDDLKIVEGIGPKIEELYHNAGIKTWKELSNTAVSKSQEILDNAGPNYTIHNPETWAKQSKLAYEGKWQELKEYQDHLNGGRA